MRLEYGHYFPSPVFFTGGLQRCTDFPRMMGVIIDYDHAVQERLTEPALDSTESHERVFDIFHIKLLQIAYRNDSQLIQYMVVAVHRYAESAHFFLADINIKMCLFGVRFDVFRPDIIIAANAIEPDWHIQVHTVDVFVPAIGYDAFIHLFGHVSESVHDIINAPEIIRVVKIYICNYCVIRMIA